MFKYLPVVLVLWCEIQRCDVYAQTDTDTVLALPEVPEHSSPCPSTSASLNPNKQNSTETDKKSVTMNGNTNYHIEHQTFYIYDSQFFRRFLLNKKDESLVTSDSTDTHRFYFYKLTWNKARQTCIREGGHLAIINSDSEERILSRMLREKNADTAWLGLHDLYEEGDWVTVMGQAIQDTGYTGWTKKWPNEPDNMGGNQNCAILINDNGMDDVNCNAVHYFFCEISA